MESARSKVLAIADLRENLIDPITYEVMTDPVMAKDGYTYERSSIQLWFDTCRAAGNPILSPMTGEVISGQELLTNFRLLPLLAKLKEVSNTDSASKRVEKGIPDVGTKVLSSKVFEELDRIISLDITKSLGLRCAQVVALGMESHGKSTLLERLIGLPLFPRDRKRCTACPIRVHLRRNPSQITTIRIRDRGNQKTFAGSESIIAIERICDEVKRLMTFVLGLQPNIAVSTQYEIVVNIQQPFVPNLDILDLPGLLGANTSASEIGQDVAKASSDLARSIIMSEKDHSLFMLVVDCRSQINHSSAAELVRTTGIEAQTIGVLTKLDAYRTEDDEDEDLLMQRLTSNELLKTHGWLMCSSRNPKDESYGRDIDRLELMEAREGQLLSREEYDVYRATGKVGLPAVRKAVQGLFEDFLCHEWIPRIINALLEEFYRTRDEHAALGLPIPKSSSKSIKFINRLLRRLDDIGITVPGHPEADLSSIEDYLVVENQTLSKYVIASVANKTGQWLRFDQATLVWDALENYNNLISQINCEYQRNQQSSFCTTSFTKGAPASSVNRGIGPVSEYNVKSDCPLCPAAHITRTRVVPALQALVSAICQFMTAPERAAELKNLIESDHYPLEELSGLQPWRLNLTDTTSNVTQRAGAASLKAGRFPQLISSIQMYISTMLGKIAEEFSAMCEEEIAQAADKENGFFFTIHGVKQGIYCFTMFWTSDGKLFAEKLISLWLRTLQHNNIENILTSFNDEDINICTNESCSSERESVLRKMIDILDVTTSLKRISQETPAIVFRGRTAT